MNTVPFSQFALENGLDDAVPKRSSNVVECAPRGVRDRLVDWKLCVGRVTDEALKSLAEHEQLSTDFLKLARQREWLGIVHLPEHGACWALRVSDDRGVITGCRYWAPDWRWLAYPAGCDSRAFVAGNPGALMALVFDEPRLAFAMMNSVIQQGNAQLLEKYYRIIFVFDPGQLALLSQLTNGCGLVTLIPSRPTVAESRGGPASDQWTESIARSVTAGAEVRVLRAPEGVDDLRQWCRDTRPNLAALAGMLQSAEQIARIETTLCDDAEADRVDIMEKLRAVSFNVNSPPPDEPVIMSVAGVGVCHPGNITTVEAQQKAGKSAYVAAGLASIMAPVERDFLGWSSNRNPRGGAVLHFDSEQSRGDHDKLVRRTLARAGLEEPRAWFNSACFTGWSVEEMQVAVRAAMADAVARVGGVHSVWLDGVGDMVHSPNDEQESFAFVRQLQQLAIEYSCSIIVILHLNPGDTGKSRGHLGSELNRKSETVLRIKKDGCGVSTVATQCARHAPIPSGEEPRFGWSDEHMRHISVPRGEAVSQLAVLPQLKAIVDAVWRDNPAGVKRNTDIVGAIKGQTGKSLSDAKRKLKAMIDLNLVQKCGTGVGYVPNL